MRSVSEDEFRPAGGRGIVLDVDRIVTESLHFRADIHVAPAVHRVLRQADDTGPLPDLVRHRHTQSRHALRLVRCELADELVDRRLGELQDAGRRRVSVCQLSAGDDLAEEVDQHQFGTASADLQARK